MGWHGREETIFLPLLWSDWMKTESRALRQTAGVAPGVHGQHEARSYFWKRWQVPQEVSEWGRNYVFWFHRAGITSEQLDIWLWLINTLLGHPRWTREMGSGGQAGTRSHCILEDLCVCVVKMSVPLAGDWASQLYVILLVCFLWREKWSNGYEF